MAEFTITRPIDAPVEHVWEVLHDFGDIQRWNPGVAKSVLTSEGPVDEGSTRRCDFSPFGAVLERIDHIEPGQRMTVNLYETFKLPISGAVADFTLAPDGDGTVLTVHYAYTLNRLGRFMKRRTDTLLRRGLGGLAKGLALDWSPMPTVLPNHAHRHECPIAWGATGSVNLAHGDYDEAWLRSLGRKGAAEWKKPRDSQRARVYRAEHAVSLLLDEENLGSVWGTQAMVDEVVGSTWWQVVVPHRPQVKVADGRGRRSGGSIGGEIRLPHQYRMPMVVLHELAHEWIMCPIRSPHGPDFTAGFLALVGEFHGAEARTLLEGAFVSERVKVTPTL